MAQHSAVSLGSRHPIHNWEYADSAARIGATGFVTADLYKVARQADDNSFWVLTATTPTWVPIAALDVSGGLEMSNADIQNAKTITFNTVPTVSPSGGTLVCDFSSYQKIIATLNNVATVNLQINVPAGAGNFQLVIIQGSSTPTTTLNWVTEGSHALWGSITIQSGAGERTLVGLLYDGSTWYGVSTPVTQILAN